MLTAITHHQMWVLDQDEALDFYVGKLGFELNMDVDMEVMRWLTVSVPGQPEREIILMLPQAPAVDDDSVEAIRDQIAKGNAGMFIMTTDDCRGDYERLSALGVEFTEEPTERFYGIDCGIRDPFGNHIRMTEPAPLPLDLPSSASQASA